jgi:hypothetical protein
LAGKFKRRRLFTTSLEFGRFEIPTVSYLEEGTPDLWCLWEMVLIEWNPALVWIVYYEKRSLISYRSLLIPRRIWTEVTRDSLISQSEADSLRICSIFNGCGRDELSQIPVYL